MSLAARGSLSRSVRYLVERHLLRRETLVAAGALFDLELRFRTEDVVGRHIYKRGLHQEALTRFLVEVASEIRPGDVVFDVGAHIGWFSLVLDRLIPDGARIYAIEPDPVTHGLLLENIERNRATRVVPLECALSDREGSGRLHRYHAKNTGRHSLLPLHQGDGDVEVRTETLDGLRRRQGLADATPRLIKIDVEGFEGFVLDGARETLRDCPLVVQEHCPGLLARAGLDPMSPLETLSSLGFVSHRLDGAGLVPAPVSEIAAATDSFEVVWRRPEGSP